MPPCPRISIDCQILCTVTFALSVFLVALNGFRGQWFIYTFRFLILFSSIIPIRLVLDLIEVAPIELPEGKMVLKPQFTSQLGHGKDVVRTPNSDRQGDTGDDRSDQHASRGTRASGVPFERQDRDVDEER